MGAALSALPQVMGFPVEVLAFAAAPALFFAAIHTLTTRLLASWATWFAAVPFAAAASLVLFVLSDDDYRGGGISRWDAYTSPGGGLATLFWVTLAVLALGGLLLAYSSRRDRGLFAFTAIVVGIATRLLVIPTVLGFSLN